MAEKEPQSSSEPFQGDLPTPEVKGRNETDTGKRKKSKKPKQDPRLIADGLQLSLKGKPPFVSFTYALTTLMESGTKIELKMLTTESVESQHIRLHSLEPNETLASIASAYRKSYTVAVILVNTEDSLKLPPEVTAGVERTKKTSFPIALVSSSDGKSLREFVARYETGELSAKLEIKDQTHIEYKPQPKGGASPGSESTVTLNTRKRGFSFRRKGKRTTINLKEEIKALLFPVSGPVVASEDEERFKVAMTIFYQYEQMVQRAGHAVSTSATLLFNKLLKHIDEMFARDFPFYLLVAYRAHKKQSYYLCDELRQFVRACVEKFERLEPISITKTMENFFIKIEDFNLMFESDSATTSIYQLLEEACEALMIFSFGLKAQDGGVVLHKAVYYRMLWIATAYKCHIHRDTGPREKVDYWRDHLTSAESFTDLSTDVIQSLKRGVEFCRLLQLPEEASFTSAHMTNVLTADNAVRPFSQLREFVIVLEPYIQLEEGFVEHILSKPRESYQLAGVDRWTAAHGDTPLLTILQDGLGFLDTVLEVSKKRQWASSSLDSEMKDWLQLVLEPVKVTGPHTDTYLKEFLSHRTGGVAKQYQETIKRDLVVKLENSLGQLSVEEFLQLYKAFYIWPPWIVQKFLGQYQIPQEVKICSDTWKDFFTVFVERFDAHHHKFLLEFFQSVAQCYLDQSRAKDYILDLLRLDVPQLFARTGDQGSIVSEQSGMESPSSDMFTLSVPDEFVFFLSDYIQRNSLRDALLDDIHNLWELIADHSEFQKLVLQVLQQELIPGSGSLHGPLSPAIKFLLKQCVTTICNGLDSLHDLSSRLTFCWGVVGSCCLKMPVTENLDWLSVYYAVIDQLGRIYSVYQSKQDDADVKSILTEDSLSTEVTECPAEGVGTFFKWISQAQQVLGMWRDRLVSQNVNYDELVLYFKQYSQISRAAVALNSGALMVDSHDVKMMKQHFLQDYELLNIFLLRYVPGTNEWCSLLHILSMYGVNMEPKILLAIKKYVIFPTDSHLNPRRNIGLENPISASVSNNFNPPGDIQLDITKELTAVALKNLVEALAKFIEPVTDLDFLTFFYLSESEIFDKHLKLQLMKLDDTNQRSVAPTPSLSLMSLSLDIEPVIKAVLISHLAKALERTKDFILRLIVGSASYVEIIAEGSLSLRSLDIEREFEILADYGEFAKIDLGVAKGLDGVKAMLQLFQYTRHIQVIHSVCKQYKLVNCLQDPSLKELIDLVETLEERKDNLTAKDAIDKLQSVAQVLRINSGQSLGFLALFSAVQDSADFHRFVVQEKQFIGEQGQQLFQQQFDLIKIQLQHEEYNEAVLNHLYAAFKLIKPFTNTEQNFGTLMASVASLNALDARRQLETVNRNINLIRLWFSRAEGDTLKSVQTELRCILTTGYYTFQFTPTPTALTSGAGSIQLNFIPHSSMYQNVGEVRETPSIAMEICWNEEAIGDFVHKLGFLDAEGEVGAETNSFLHINQTATKLFGLYSKLRELGHPNFLGTTMKTNLHCSLSLEEADELVNSAGQLLISWEKELVALRTEYEQLLYFSVPKVLHLYQALTAHQPSPAAVVQDVGFLFENKPHVQEQLKETVMGLLESKPHLNKRKAHSTPMHVVGMFLKSLFSNLALSTNSLKRRRRGSVGSTVSRSSSAGQSTHILHSCAGFSQSQLLRLIISIYGGVPEAFEVYHCRPTSTEEELRLFMNSKRATKRPFQYLILEVNKLSYRLQEALVRIHFDLKQSVAQLEEAESPCVHFVETGPSLLQEMPWLLRMDYKGEEPQLDFEEASSTSKSAALHIDDFACLQLVYGNAGDGKTHYIESQISACPEYQRVAVNEAFTPLSTIQKLCSMTFEEPEPAVFFNFTLLPPGDAVSEKERTLYNELIESINWFFFDLFILGYVEDPATGQSFRFPGGLKIAIYIEVPSRVRMDPNASLEAFYEDIPSLGLLGSKYFIQPGTPFVVDSDVQLVCKYLRAYKTGGTRGIDRLYKEGGGLFSGRKPGVPVKFSLDNDLSESDCRKLLDRYTPPHMKENKATQKLFIKYMKRRCAFLDNCPAFNYNAGATEYLTIGGSKGEKKKNDTRELGSTLMDTMLKEVSDFCDPFIREDWALKPHHQLIYDFKDGGGTIGLMSLHPDKIRKEDVEKFKKIGVQIPNMFELYSRDCLDSLLSRALDVPLNDKGRLAIVDDCRYVLTLDFALKMLNIHERAEGGVPVIIQGETGVGKTALIEMLSRLWNYSLFSIWNVYKERIIDFLKKKLKELPSSSFKKHSGSPESSLALLDNTTLREDSLMQIAELPLPSDNNEEQFFSIIRRYLVELAGDPLLSVLDLRAEDDDSQLTVPLMVASAQFKDNPKDISRLLFKFLNCKVKTLFFKLNVHAALQPSEILEFFMPIFEQAKMLQKAYQRFTTKVKVPFITVFLDEVNTSSCLGLFKEVIIDRTLDGEPIPSNVFIVGACNPHRGNSLAAHGNQETWIRGTYYVRQLHPTIECLMWDYGALGEQQERDYILAKMKLFNQDTANADLANLTELIVLSQNLSRKYAFEQLKDCGLTEAKASEYSRSCVSQRDIQRVFTFYQWLYKMYTKYIAGGDGRSYNARAIAVALGLVYYLRLNTRYRTKYREVLDHEMAPSNMKFSSTFDKELDWYINIIDLPKGIAKTQALKENLFATIVCTMTHTPLIIVGSPGSSKTLSFNLTLANLKGQESKVPQFRDTEIFKALDPQIYQCSRRTTSKEITTVFSRAINRQRDHQITPLPVYCVVFMDEAGLPEERHESLKVLHYYLDSQEVSFVAISNQVLDAAKTNRAVSLFRPEATRDELTTLAKGCLCETPDKPPPELWKDMGIVANFCTPYLTLMSKEKFLRFFGLRDFINFISYLRRKRKDMLDPQLVMEALERNFNGVSKEDFEYICKLFLRAVHAKPEQVNARNILDILVSAMLDHPLDTGAENEMRYKLIIDSSDDGSLVRLLFFTGVLLRRNTRVYVCSDFPGDAELQKVNTIAAIRHSVTEGHTVVLSQTDSIHESFYDLFNRRFHRIDAASGPCYYANIAIGAHIKPCRVHPDFDCVVVVKQSELESIPPPFLNRFEKYYLSHELVLEATLSNLPPALAAVVRAALDKAGEFVANISGSSSLYGLQKETLFSLLMSLLPPLNHTYQTSYDEPSGSTPSIEVQTTLMETLLRALKENAGFQIPTYSADEAKADTDEVMEILLQDSEFSGQILRLMSAVNKSEVRVTIHTAVRDALHLLHLTPTLDKVQAEASANTCMVISMLTHWLVRYLCKRVMQLMTSEALCVHHRKIPTSFIQAYLDHQHHFGLKELLENQTRKMDMNDPSAANKLVCFMRSSSPLHQLPAQYPLPAHQPPITNGDNTSLLQELVFTNTEELVVHKMSSVTSFTNVNNLLKSFALSSTHRVMVIIINMEETTKQLVNHLRIMIEENESKYASDKKLFALLLHFQTCRPSHPCYPVMFLPGWDFTYLEMIGYSPKSGVLDIRDWFKQCYETPSSSKHPIAPHLNDLLKEAISAISSRVIFREHPCSPFNTAMKIPERKKALEKLFFEKGVGEVLCERFNSYWTPNVMIEYLEKAAFHAQQHESPNVIDNLQTNFKRLFVDFLVYMVQEMNKEMNIDVLFDPDSSQETVKLFLDILRVVPIPKLAEITIMRVANDATALTESRDVIAPPKFPYFALISSGIEKLVEQTQRDFKQNIDGTDDLLTLLQCSEQDRALTMTSLFTNLQTKLIEVAESYEKTPLTLGLKALLSLDPLWSKYLEDFTQQKLLLEFDNSGTSDKVRRAAFGNIENRTAVQRVAILHVYVYIHKLNLAKVVSILRPLDQFEDAVLTLTSLAATTATKPAQSLMANVEDGSDLLGCSEALSSFIIGTLFKAIAFISMGYFAQGERRLTDKEVEQVKLWFTAYRDVMSMPSLHEHLYVTRSQTTEAQHSAMHLIYLLARSRPLGDVPTLQCALHTFNQVFNKFFNTRCELQGSVPRLEALASAIMEGLPQLPSWDMELARGALEGLLAHHFSPYHTLYHSEDVEWFLTLANGQKRWQASFIMDGIYEFEYSEDLNAVLGELDATSELTLTKLAGSMPTAVFKFYLRRIILTSIKSTDDPILQNSVLVFYNKTEAHKLIIKVLCSNPDLGRAGPYIPTYYQLCDYISPSPSSENKLMQQPLAHLYFLTVMDDLKDSNFGLSGLVKTVHKISKYEHWFEGDDDDSDDQYNDGSFTGCELVLLHIEEQALAQVIIKEVARHLDPGSPAKTNALFAVLTEVNAILDDKWMGGGNVGGHGLTLVMHLLREKKSFHKFINTLTTDFNMLSDGINCLLPFHQALGTPTPASVKPDSQFFLPYQDLGSEFNTLYSRILAAMNAIHSSHGSATKSREKEFGRLADECLYGELNVVLPTGGMATMNKMASFRMTLWLVTYNEFFVKKRQSKMVAQAVAHLAKKAGSTFVQLIQSFLDPELMNRGENSRGPGQDFSPLKRLFTSNTHEQTSTADLQCALVHLITAVLAGPPTTTNLWCLLFNQEQIPGTYVPGFMYDSTIGPDGRFYGYGVELSSEGFYSCMDTIQHVTRGTFGLHSLYTILWTNFSSLFVALLTQPNCKERLLGKMFSSGDTVVELCSDRMMRLWDLLCSGLSVSEEERALLVGTCLNRLIEQQISKSPELQGRLTTPDERDVYESHWHTEIFTPSWNTLKMAFEKANSSYLAIPVIKDIIKLDSRYPWAPGVPSLTDVVLSSNTTADSSHHLYHLSQFVIEYPRLRVGMDLLPSLLELYQWLHSELCYAISYEQASSVTLGRLSKVLTKHSMLMGLPKLKELFNRYIQLTGCTGHLRPVPLGEDTPLLHLLSSSSEHGPDLLFTVAKDVVVFLNEFFEHQLQALSGTIVGDSLFRSTRPRVPVMEFVHHYMLIAQAKSCNDLLQLIHGRTLLPPAYPITELRATPAYLPGHLSTLIDLQPLQDDILSLCVVGMPLISHSSIESLRLPFKFKDDLTKKPASMLKLQDFAIDLESVSTKLPEAFKQPLSYTEHKRMEYEFHCAGYHTIMEVIAGLRTAIGHLIQDVADEKRSSELVNTKLPEYLACLYEYDPQNSVTDVFHEIGINGLTPAQHTCLDSLSLVNLFYTRSMFIGWAEDGLYDFCSLPFGLKKHMCSQDEEALNLLPQSYEGSPGELLKALRSLVEVLVHLETSICKAGMSTPQKGLIVYLEKLKVCSDFDTIHSIIPDNVCLENYVSLRVVLRRVITRVQKTISDTAQPAPEPVEEKWNEFITDFWDKWLPTFRRQGYNVRPFPTSTTKPPETTDVAQSYSSLLNELIRFTSERNLLEAFADEELNLQESVTMAPAGDEGRVEDNHAAPPEPQLSDEELLQLAKKVSTGEVVKFLESVHLSQYATTVEENDISGEVLLQFQDEELEEMEINSAIDRLKIVVFFKRYLMEKEGITHKIMPPSEVAKVLSEYRQLKEYSEAFLANGMDSDLIVSASDSVLRECGVEKGAHRLMIRSKFNVPAL